MKITINADIELWGANLKLWNDDKYGYAKLTYAGNEHEVVIESLESFACILTLLLFDLNKDEQKKLAIISRINSQFGVFFNIFRNMVKQVDIKKKGDV